MNKLKLTDEQFYKQYKPFVKMVKRQSARSFKKFSDAVNNLKHLKLFCIYEDETKPYFELSFVDKGIKVDITLVSEKKIKCKIYDWNKRQDPLNDTEDFISFDSPDFARLVAGINKLECQKQ